MRKKIRKIILALQFSNALVLLKIILLCRIDFLAYIFLCKNYYFNWLLRWPPLKQILKGHHV